MSKDFEEILFEEIFPDDIKSITKENDYTVSVLDYFNGVYLVNENRTTPFKYPLFYAFRTTNKVTEYSASGKPVLSEMTLFIGLVKESNYDNAEPVARSLCKSLRKYLLPENNSLLKNSSFQSYRIVNDYTFTLKSNNNYKSIAQFEILLKINL